MIVVAGEALVDLVGEPDGRYRPVPGGSPANVAVGLARLGSPTELLARLGTGVFGALVREHLARNDVGLTHAVQAAEPATLAVVSLDAEGRASYDFYVTGTADWGWTPDELPRELPKSAVALCTGSLAVALAPGAAELAKLVRRERDRGQVTVVIDPNVRPALLGDRSEARRVLGRIIEAADVVKVSDEDLTWLEPADPVEQVAANWLGGGPALVVVTRGERGAYAATRHGATVTVPARPVRLIDTVGAGDAFTSGLVDALRRRQLLGGATARDRLAGLDAATLTQVVEDAGLVAAITCGRRGADPPTASEVAAQRDTAATSLPADMAEGDT
ncbi:MAG TPA: carbohydrate kinase [Jiangellaceae bacterium]|nr:carbohydrate kinase [Jiangellaceae bacterium]